MAVAEIGLDFTRHVLSNTVHGSPESSKEAQTFAFKEQVTLASDLGLPISVHCRGGWSSCLTRDIGT